MMGEPVGRQDRLFYAFDLEDMVPADHLLRRIDAALDLSWLRGEMAPHYSHLGCPSVCPEPMVRMLIVGYCHSIRSERRLCQEVKVNLAYRWFCGLGIEDKVPNHSTFSVNRHGRFRDSDLLRKVFEDVVRRCMTAGLVGGEGCAVDASVIEANASRYQRIEGSEVDWTAEQRARRPVRASRPVSEYWPRWRARIRRPTPCASPRRCRRATPRRPGRRGAAPRCSSAIA